MGDAMTDEQIDTSFKKVRGMARASLDLIERMAAIIEEVEPITGRGVGYKLFTARLISSMSVNNMQRVYRLLKRAREDDLIPWEWIVDETRGMEKVSAWDNPKDFAESVASQYRRDFWTQQPNRCEVWSEKGTVRGILKPVLDEYGVGFRVMHGFASATIAHDIAEDDDGRDLTALYVGDYDPSGLYMSERDLPDRLDLYGGFHVTVKRIALIKGQLSSLPSFPATDKRRDPRYRWFIQNHGRQCWEIDAMDPRTLRNLVRTAIRKCIGDREAWERCERINRAEKESLEHVLGKWGAAKRKAAP
jgi:hypothetical protein